MAKCYIRDIAPQHHERRLAMNDRLSVSQATAGSHVPSTIDGFMTQSEGTVLQGELFGRVASPETLVSLVETLLIHTKDFVHIEELIELAPDRTVDDFWRTWKAAKNLEGMRHMSPKDFFHEIAVRLARSGVVSRSLVSPDGF